MCGAYEQRLSIVVAAASKAIGNAIINPSVKLCNRVVREKFHAYDLLSE